MNRTAKTSRSLLEHWGKFLSDDANQGMMLQQHQEMSDDIRKLELELGETSPGRWKKIKVLRNEYLHWLYLMEIIGDNVGDEDIPF